MKLIPLANKILVEPISEAVKSVVQRSDSEIQDKKLRPEKGKVLAVGKDYSGELTKGNVVYFDKYGVEWITIGKQELVVGTAEYFFCKE